MTKSVSPERTGWRDEKISLRHRDWGFNCPAVDIDFLMVEYDYGKVRGLVEYKNEMAHLQYPSHPSYKAIADLADRAQIPFIACRYTTNFSSWHAHPINKIARKFLPEPFDFNEKGWVKLLYRIRGRSMPQDLFLCCKCNEWKEDAKKFWINNTGPMCQSCYKQQNVPSSAIPLDTVQHPV